MNRWIDIHTNLLIKFLEIPTDIFVERIYKWNYPEKGSLPSNIDLVSKVLVCLLKSTSFDAKSSKTMVSPNFIFTCILVI